VQNPNSFIGLTKPFLLSHNLAHLFFAKGRQKPNKLNSFPLQIGVLRTLFARVLKAPKGAPQACGF
jgi:hypothetical protein